MELNQYYMYSLQTETNNKVDETDTFVSYLNALNNYTDLEKFIKEHWGEFEERKLVHFDGSSRFLDILNKPDCIEIYEVNENSKAVWSKGWRKPVND